MVVTVWITYHRTPGSCISVLPPDQMNSAVVRKQVLHVPRGGICLSPLAKGLANHGVAPSKDATSLDRPLCWLPQGVLRGVAFPPADRGHKNNCYKFLTGTATKCQVEHPILVIVPAESQ